MLNPCLSRAPMATIEGLLLVSLCMVLSCNAARPVKDSPSLTNMRNPNLTNMKNPNVRNITTPKLRNGTIGPNYGPSSWSTFVESLQFMIPQNYARLKVGELPLVWDWKVESYAQWWAEQRKVDCNMTHSHGPYGENIFWGSGQSWTPLDAVRFWVEEKQYYSYDTNSCEVGQMCGHYTQVVWRDSRSIGCARVVCNNGDVFMTCNYDPPGNYIGEKPY